MQLSWMMKIGSGGLLPALKWWRERKAKAQAQNAAAEVARMAGAFTKSPAVPPTGFQPGPYAPQGIAPGEPVFSPAVPRSEFVSELKGKTAVPDRTTKGTYLPITRPEELS